MYEMIAKKNDKAVVYKMNLNSHSYLKVFFTSNVLTLNFLYVWDLLKKWAFKYMKSVIFLGVNFNFSVFLFFHDKLFNFKKFANDLSFLKFLLMLTFSSMHLSVNYYDLLNYVFQYYSIGMLLSMFKLESKSYRRSLKGVKVLVNFLSKKMNSKYYKTLALMKVNGLTKNYLKFFYLLSSILAILNVKIFLWNPMKSWNKNGMKKLKSMKRSMKKKLMKVEQKM